MLSKEKSYIFMAQGSSASLEQRFIQHRDDNTVPLIQGQGTVSAAVASEPLEHITPKEMLLLSTHCVKCTQTKEKGDPDLFLIILFYSHVGSQGPFLNLYFVQAWAQHSNQFL